MAAVQRVAAAVASALSVHVGQGEPLCVALSGGMDSIVLLDAVANIRNDVSAVHVHHGLSPNADAWADFCLRWCEARGIDLSVQRVSVAAEGRGLEAAARTARYAVFARVAARWILQAHHADDAVETLMLRLNRGTGLRGLGGIPAMRVLDERHVLLRPLLELPRAVLREYSQERRLVWIEDESNLDTRLDRNYLRKVVVPALAQRFPAWRENWLRAAAHARDAQSLLDDLAIVDVGNKPERLRLETLRGLSSARLRNALRYFLAVHGVELPETAHLADVERRIRVCGPDALLGVKVDQRALMHYRGELHCVPANRLQSPPRFQYALKPGTSLSIPELQGTLHMEPSIGDGISARHPSLDQLVACSRRAAEALKSAASRPTRSLKNLFQESGVPPWERAWIPRIGAGDELVWVGGVGIATEWQAAAAEPAWRLRWDPWRT